MRTNWLVCSAVVFAGVAGACQIGKVPPALPQLRDDLGLGLVAAGWVLSIFSLVAVVGGVAVGLLADRLTHRTTLVAGLVLCGIASGLGALSGGAAGLLAGRVAEGLGFVMIVAAAPSLLLRVVAPADQRLAFGLWSAYFPAGISIMMVLAPSLLATTGWRGLWLGNAALLLLTAALLAVATAPFRGGRRGMAWPGLAGLVATVTAPGPLLLAAAFAFYSMQFLAVFGFVPTWLVEEQGYRPQTAATLTAIAVAGGVLGNLAGGALLQRGHRRWRLIAAASAVMGLSAFGIYDEALADPIRYALLLCFSTVGCMIPASLLAGVPQHAPMPGTIGAVNGLLVQGSNTGQLLGPPVLAWMVTGFGGWGAAPYMVIGFAALTILCALMIRRLEPAS